MADPTKDDIPTPAGKGNAADHYLAQAQKLSAAAKKWKAQSEDLQRKLEEATKQNREFRYKTKFELAARESGVHPDAIDDAFAAAGFDLSKDAPTPEEIKNSLSVLQRTKKYYFRQDLPADPDTDMDPPSAGGKSASGGERGAGKNPNPSPAPPPGTRPGPGGRGAGPAPNPGGEVSLSQQLADPNFVMRRSPKEMLELLKSGVVD